MHLGWLNASQDDRKNISRAEEFGDKHPICKLPDADPLIVSVFRNVGPCLGTGMGAFSITWQELDSYSRLSQAELTAWESEQVITMSKLYCSYLNVGKKASRAPYEREYTEEEIQDSKDAMTRVLKSENDAFDKLTD